MNRNRVYRFPKGLAIPFLILIIALFVVGNVFFHGYTDTIGLSDGKEWSQISYKVTAGEEDKFKAELASPKKIKIIYKGRDTSDVQALITLRDDAGSKYTYSYRIYEEYLGDDLVTNSELDLIDPQ